MWCYIIIHSTLNNITWSTHFLVFLWFNPLCEPAAASILTQLLLQSCSASAMHRLWRIASDFHRTCLCLWHTRKEVIKCAEPASMSLALCGHVVKCSFGCYSISPLPLWHNEWCAILFEPRWMNFPLIHQVQRLIG